MKQVSFLMVFSLAFVALSGCASEPVLREATVNFDTKQEGLKMREALFGNNLQWTQGGDGFLAGGKQTEVRWNQDLLDAAKQMNIPLLRFPGGELANSFEWRNTIGNANNRKSGTNYAGKSESSIFGLDEFLELCDQLQTKAVMTLNVNQSTQDILDLVDYMHPEKRSVMSKLRDANIGDKRCPVVFWEFGNEVYSPNTPGSLTSKEYAEKVVSLSRELRIRYPEIKLGAAFEISFQQAAWMHSVMPHIMSWNEELLPKVTESIDFAALHFYAPFDRDLLSRNENNLVLVAPDVFAQNLIAFKGLQQPSQLKLGVTEFNAYFGSKLILNDNISSTVSALYNAMMLAQFTAGGVDFANFWSLANNGQFGMLQTANPDGVKSNVVVPVMQQLRRFAGLRQIGTQVQAPMFSVSAKGNIPAMQNVSSLVVFAVAKEDRTLRVMLVNRSQQDTLVTRLLGGAKTVGDRAELFASSQDRRSWVVNPVTAGVSEVTLPPLSVAFVDIRM